MQNFMRLYTSQSKFKSYGQNMARVYDNQIMPLFLINLHKWGLITPLFLKGDITSTKIIISRKNK